LLDPIGGAAIAFISGVVYVDRKQIPVWSTLDALVPFLSVMWVAIGLSNLASGKAFGMATQLPWGIDLWGAHRHPTQVYQVLAGFVILGFTWPRAKGVTSASGRPGETFMLFLILSAVAWMVVEAFRGDSSLLPGGLRTGQVIAWFVLSGGLWGWGWIRKKSSGR
jgi:prolipoprotein diacylglyceryltransferase